MTLFVRILCLFLLLAPLASQAQSWEGFLLVEEAPLPSAISKENIKEAVFQIVTAGTNGDPAKLYIQDITGLKKPNLKNIQFNTIEYIKAFQVRNCIQQKIKMCPVMLSKMNGTGFFKDDTKTFATALHIFRDWIFYVSANNPGISISGLTPPFLVFDYNRDKKDTLGKLIFNSVLKADAPITFLSLNPNLYSVFDIDHSPYMNLYSSSDYMELTISNTFGKAFLTSRPQSEAPLLNEKIYCVGYPKLSVFYEENGPIGAVLDNWSLAASNGSILNKESLFFDSSCVIAGGDSGGPALDSEGRVIGILVSGFKYARILTSDKSTLEKFWAN